MHNVVTSRRLCAVFGAWSLQGSQGKGACYGAAAGAARRRARRRRGCCFLRTRQPSEPRPPQPSASAPTTSASAALHSAARHARTAVSRGVSGACGLWILRRIAAPLRRRHHLLPRGQNGRALLFKRAVALAEGLQFFFALAKAEWSTPTSASAASPPLCAPPSGRTAPRRASPACSIPIPPPTTLPARPLLRCSPPFPARRPEPTSVVLDSEGRCVITIHGDLAIPNVYVPANSSDDPAQQEERLAFKAAFLRARRARAPSSRGFAY